jgi:LCP family protein required for cell wall assembly
MPDAPGPDVEAPPSYTKYRARPRLLPRRQVDGIAELRDREGGPSGGGGHGGRRRIRRPGRGAWTWQRALKWVVVAFFAWIALAVVLFFVSAQIQAGKVSGETKAALDDAGWPLTSANNILVLGSDQRVKGTKEPGASTSGPSRSDSIMLLRVGAGHNSRLSIARDTVVDIPGHGASKINAAYAYGGAALAIQTVKQYLGVEVNHVIEVNFDRFPGLINALGGVTYTGKCVVSKINGGNANGGYTLRLKKGSTHIDGDQALALARTRKNLCRPQETDLDRAARQQFLISAMKDKLTSVGGMFGLPNGAFYRLPLIGWRTPRAFTSDMNGLTLGSVFTAMATSGSPTTQVLGTLSGTVPQAQKDAAVQKFLRS